MRVTFQLRFHTQYGQTLLLSGNHPLLGDGIIEKAVPLEYLNDQAWQVTLVFPPGAVPDAPITYNYILRDADGSVVEDWGKGRVLDLVACQANDLLIIDAWNDPGFVQNAFYTEPFKQVLLRPQFTEFRAPAVPFVSHRFQVKAPLLQKGQTLCLLGDNPALGQWNTNAPVLLSRGPGHGLQRNQAVIPPLPFGRGEGRGEGSASHISTPDFLTVELDLREAAFPISYKYGVYDVTRGAFIRYEDGPNRVLHDTVALQKLTIIDDGFAALPATAWKAGGVAIPVFSLRSEQSFGVGEFADLKLLADWCHQTGLKLIQILPVNDTSATHTWMDSYPYAAISAFALHPLYLRLSEIVVEPNRAALSELEGERKRLNGLESVDYEAVMKAKMAFLRRIFPLQKKQTFGREEYRAFFAENRRWLVPYAVFSYLRDLYGTADCSQWPAHRRYRAEDIAALVTEGSAVCDGIAFHYFVQYHLHHQLQEARNYAHAQGVILKGDIPIGVALHGADTWHEPDLFHLDQQAGAPPDPFSATGQNWRLPTYNWPRMKADGFAWWKQRFEQMGCYFDAFRIDHILGFFRIWSIPAHAVQGIMGRFVPAIPVDIKELNARGIRFDRNRYTQPYINEAILRELFGSDAELVKGQFLQSESRGRYSLKPQFATQRQVEDFFVPREQNPRNARLKQGLFDLIGNVLLFEVEGSHGRQFHFRFGIERTSSFRHLETGTRERLKELYTDYFFRRQDAFWAHEALEKLPALKRATAMLICGEDLGLVPDCVPGVLRQLGLLSLQVQRMPKLRGQQFSRPADASYLSVVTPSTHDMSTIRGWWKEDRRTTQSFYNDELGQPGAAPAECPASVNGAIVMQHLASPAMWSIFQLQDLLGMDEQLRRKDVESERINVPANPRNYWRYRMHLTLETLLRADNFNRELKQMLQRTERACLS